MFTQSMHEALVAFKAGTLSEEQMLAQFKSLPYETVDGFARLDHHRMVRTGTPEVIYAAGKTPEQVVTIFRRLAACNPLVMATRVTEEMVQRIQPELPEATYHASARILYQLCEEPATRVPGILVLTAGTSDLPVAEEAALTAELLGNEVTRIYDVGVAGLHRLLDQLPQVQTALVIVVVAGMEGALASVVGGLTAAPVIAVPTSVGYGASFNGLAPLLGMLNSCAPGVSVVNIDNGFGAGCLAARINALAHQKDSA